MRLKQLRKQKKLTQSDIAKFLSMTTNNYQGYEYGTTEPSLETLITLANYYGVSIDYICEHDTPNQISLGTLNPIQLDIIDKIQNLPEIQLQQICDYIDNLTKN